MAAILLVATVAILSPRVVRAVTAQLVQNIDSPIRNPWTSSCIMEPSSGSTNSCTIALQPGQAVAIQTMTFQGYTNGHEHVLLQLETSIGSEEAVWNHEITNNVVPIVTPSLTSQFAASESLTLYANSGAINVGMTTDGPNSIVSLPSSGGPIFGGLGGTVTLIGYSVNVGSAAAPSTN